MKLEYIGDLMKKKSKEKDEMEVIIDNDKLSFTDYSMCHVCRKDWKTCENEDIKTKKDGKIVIWGPTVDNYGYPILLYCGYFEKKSKKGGKK